MTIAPIRQPVTTIPARPRPDLPDWRNVFVEPVYDDGRPWRDPYADEPDEDEGAVITT